MTEQWYGTHDLITLTIYWLAIKEKINLSFYHLSHSSNLIRHIISHFKKHWRNCMNSYLSHQFPASFSFSIMQIPRLSWQTLSLSCKTFHHHLIRSNLSHSFQVEIPSLHPRATFRKGLLNQESRRCLSLLEENFIWDKEWIEHETPIVFPFFFIFL